MEKNLTDFWLIEAKIQIKIKKFQKTSTIIELYTLNVGHNINFQENLRKKIDLILTNYWLIKAKMKMKMMKFGKISTSFEVSTLKFGYRQIFMKI